MTMNARLLAVALFATVVAGPPAAAADPSAHTMHVYKTPWCGCCTAWADRMKALGYTIRMNELDDLAALRQQAAVPAGVEGCHLAVIEGYVLEGHVPPEAIARLIDERPKVHGIAVPGMPRGSVGMGDDPRAAYDVVTFGAGTTEGSRVFYRAGR